MLYGYKDNRCVYILQDSQTDKAARLKAQRLVDRWENKSDPVKETKKTIQPKNELDGTTKDKKKISTKKPRKRKDE
jgi:hypothetical protein